MTDDIWVMDVTRWEADGLRAFCPLRENMDVVVGLTVLADTPPGPVAGVFHQDGQEACNAWCAEHQDEIAAVTASAEKQGSDT